MLITRSRYDLTGGGDDPRPDTHLSDVIRHIVNTAVKPGERPPSHTLSDQERMRAGAHWEMGFIWERLVETVFIDRMADRIDVGMVPGLFGPAERQSITELDDIMMGIDLFLVRPVPGRVVECKATWRSATRAETDEKFEAEFWEWTTQTKGYCQAKKTPFATIFVLWVCGDYRESGPYVERFDLEYTQDELDKNWRMILNNRVAAERAKRKGK